MAANPSTDDNFTFVGGLNTEGGFFITPKNSWKEGDNVVPNTDGSLVRRKALDYEGGHALYDTNTVDDPGGEVTVPLTLLQSRFIGADAADESYYARGAPTQNGGTVSAGAFVVNRNHTVTPFVPSSLLYSPSPFEPDGINAITAEAIAMWTTTSGSNFDAFFQFTPDTGFTGNFFQFAWRGDGRVTLDITGFGFVYTTPSPVSLPCHCALVFAATETRAYINGDLVYTVGSSPLSGGDMRVTLGDRAGYSFGVTQYSISGFRVRQEEVYTGASFSPPSVIPPPDFPVGDISDDAITQSKVSLGAYSVSPWENINGNGELEFFVAQTGNLLHFYLATSGPVSATKKDFVLNLDPYQAYGNTNVVGTNVVTCASCYGKLLVTSIDTDPILITYDAATDDITVTMLELEIRDFNGVRSPERPQTELTQAEWTALTPSFWPHALYNLYNQGWQDAQIDAYKAVHSGDLPANSKQWIYGKDTSDDFDVAVLDKQDFGSSTAPRGRFILKAFYQDRATVIQQHIGTTPQTPVIPPESNYYDTPENWINPNP